MKNKLPVKMYLMVNLSQHWSLEKALFRSVNVTLRYRSMNNKSFYLDYASFEFAVHKLVATATAATAVSRRLKLN